MIVYRYSFARHQLKQEITIEVFIRIRKPLESIII